MLTVGKVLKELNKIAPPKMAYEWDRIGLQVGDPDAPVTRIAVSLDSSIQAVEFAVSRQCQLLISHHPVIWDKLSHLKVGDHSQNVARLLIQNNINFIAAHTNWDCAPHGVNCTLAETLELQNIVPFGDSPMRAGLKLITFVPGSHVQQLLNELSDAGAGQIGDYSRCAFYDSGTGTFLGGDSTNPAIGKKGVIESVEEVRLEMLVEPYLCDNVEDALRKAHPYEEPAFDFVQLASRPVHPIARIGDLPSELSVQEFQSHLDEKLDCRSQVWKPEGEKAIKKVALCGGAASDVWSDALKHGADAFVTGEIPQNVALEGAEAGIVMVAAGHYNTEQPGMVTMTHLLRKALSIDTFLFEPEPGQAGRPL